MNRRDLLKAAAAAPLLATVPSVEAGGWSYRFFDPSPPRRYDEERRNEILPYEDDGVGIRKNPAYEDAPWEEEYWEATFDADGNVTSSRSHFKRVNA